jgi:putative hydrolase of the HAD superfamily
MQAVIFDMFETLASLFEGRSYFSEDMAKDAGIPEKEFKEAWHKTEEGRSTGKYTVGEAVSIVLNELGAFSGEVKDVILVQSLPSLLAVISILVGRLLSLRLYVYK